MGGPGGAEEGVEVVPAASATVPPLAPTASASVPEVDKMDQYEVKEQVGKGSFGQAFVVIHRETKVKMVMKKVRLARQSEAQRKASFNEMQLVPTLRHPFIVTCHDAWVERGHTICIVYGYCESGDLASYLRQRAKSKNALSEDQVRKWFAQLVLGLEYLHCKKILHRDLKSSNVFLTAQGDIQIGDFGLAKILGDGETAKSMVGTPNYMSPELFPEKGEKLAYDFKSDVWALGCVLYELTALRPAFSAFNMEGLVQKIRKVSVSPLPPGYSAEWCAAVKSMLRRAPDDRPTVSTLLTQAFMQTALRSARARAVSLTEAAEKGLPPPEAVREAIADRIRTNIEVLDSPKKSTAVRPKTAATKERAAAAINTTTSAARTPLRPQSASADVSASCAHSTSSRATRTADDHVRSAAPTAADAPGLSASPMPPVERTAQTSQALHTALPASPPSPMTPAFGGGGVQSVDEVLRGSDGSSVAVRSLEFAGAAVEASDCTRQLQRQVAGDGTGIITLSTVETERQHVRSGADERAALRAPAPRVRASHESVLSDGVDGGWSRGHLRAVLQLAGRLQRRGRTQELAQLLGNFVAAADNTNPPMQPAGNFNLGDKVVIGKTRRLEGVIRYFGGVVFAAGDWVGIELTEPQGKNDGCVQGIQYFACEPNCGLFVRAGILQPEAYDQADYPPGSPMTR